MYFICHETSKCVTLFGHKIHPSKLVTLLKK